eukprot:IDg9254t1
MYKLQKCVPRRAHGESESKRLELCCTLPASNGASSSLIYSLLLLRAIGIAQHANAGKRSAYPRCLILAFRAPLTRCIGCSLVAIHPPPWHPINAPCVEQRFRTPEDALVQYCSCIYAIC